MSDVKYKLCSHSHSQPQFQLAPFGDCHTGFHSIQLLSGVQWSYSSLASWLANWMSHRPVPHFSPRFHFPAHHHKPPLTWRIRCPQRLFRREWHVATALLFVLAKSVCCSRLILFILHTQIPTLVLANR